jgi:hypothetical protein
MNSLQNSTIKDCKGIGSNVLFSNGHVAVFGDLPNNDLVFIKRFKGKSKSELFDRNVNQEIAENNKVSISLFATDDNWTFDASHILSKSKNSAFLGQQMKGKAIGIFNQGKLVLA